MKFGGTSVADAEHIIDAAKRMVRAREEGNSVVAVLSARGATTDQLVEMAQEISSEPHPREMDMLLSTGERISCALCAMALNDLGRQAISLSGSQAGIVTDTSHTKARILDVRADRIRAALEAGHIVLVAGFQGVSTARDVTTLGRGGSDTTAVALAAALGADVCEIYTDVDGVFSADPRIVPDARKLPVLSFEEMLEMSASGAKVLQLRSVEYARNYGVRIHVRPASGRLRTLVVSEEETDGTPPDHRRDPLHRGRSRDAHRRPRPARHRRAHLRRARRGRRERGHDRAERAGLRRPDGGDLLTVPRSDVSSARRAPEGLTSELGLQDLITDEQMGKVSVVGAGMRSYPGVAAKVFQTLGEREINIEMISTSPIKISCVIDADKVADAVRSLHEAFELDRDAVVSEDGGPR